MTSSHDGSDGSQDRVQRLTEIEGIDLVHFLAAGENPVIGCEEESHHSCAHKREYENRLEKYNIEALMQRPECQACGCPLVVIQDA